MSTKFPENLNRFTGIASHYDQYRPQPPLILVDILTQLAEIEKPNLVVDLGSGTGLSTRIWGGRAKQVIGIEPNADMRRQAEERTTLARFSNHIHYQEGIATRTGLPDESADIVTCSQALHWFEPEPTFIEVNRILRSGGVFAAIDCDWPPTINWQIEQVYQAVREKASVLSQQLGINNLVKTWPKSEHLDRIQKSQQFKYTKEILLHSIEKGNPDRLVGLATSFSGVAALLKNGICEEELGLVQLRDTAKQIMGDTLVPWFFSYRVRIGIK